MNLGKILLFAFVLFYAAAVITFASGIGQTKPITVTSYANVSDNSQYLRQNYESRLKSLLLKYSEDEAFDTQKLESELLLLTVPTEYQNLHFEIVNTIFRMNLAQPEEKSVARTRLEQLVSRYSWLASNLSLFIINNFN